MFDDYLNLFKIGQHNNALEYMPKVQSIFSVLLETITINSVHLSCFRFYVCIFAICMYISGIKVVIGLRSTFGGGVCVGRLTICQTPYNPK